VRCSGALIALAVAAGCGTGAMRAVGYSEPRAPGRSASQGDGGAPSEPSPVPADFRSRYGKLGEPFVSEGHARRYKAQIWLDEAAQRAWVQLPRAMPDGAVVVEEAFDLEGPSKRPAGLLVMEKAGGAWRFFAVGPDGQLAADARVAACARCHEQAPHDDVFLEVTPEVR
jgi:hypothetical protein